MIGCPLRVRTTPQLSLPIQVKSRFPLSPRLHVV